MRENIPELMEKFHHRKIRLWLDEGRLRYQAPKGEMKGADIQILKKNKEDIVEWLELNSRSVELTVTEDNYEAFPLTDIQLAYSLGKNPNLNYGGVSCHTYMEIEYPDLDIERVNSALKTLINNHSMLHTVINHNGTQKTLEEIPEYFAGYNDLRGMEEENSGDILREVRKSMQGKVYKTGEWPQFEFAVNRMDKRSVLHFSMEFIIADWTSMWMILAQFETLCLTDQKLEFPSLGFRDCVLYEKSLKSSSDYEKDKRFWLDKVETLPLAPELPVRAVTENSVTEFKRHFFNLEKEEWERFKKLALERGVTPTAAVLTAYGAVLQKWSSEKRFSVNLTLLNRKDAHPEINRVVGDFTSVMLLEMDWNRKENFADKGKTINSTLFENMDHSSFSGIEVMRELSVKQRKTVFNPIVFTSAIGVAGNTGVSLKGKFIGGITQTPQVFIDCQVIDGDFGMNINWDVREGIFEERIVEDMFGIFGKILKDMASSEETWDEDYKIDIPDWQKVERELINDTSEEVETRLLHQGVVEAAEKYPHSTAVIEGDVEITYEDLVAQASYIAEGIERTGTERGSRIGVAVEKSAHQVTVVLGILSAGCIYVPIDLNQGAGRVESIIDSADISLLITDSGFGEEFSEKCRVLKIDEYRRFDKPLNTEGSVDELAYIIFTSGSTGVPKGVAVTHDAAMNTILDINERFSVTKKDAVLGLSKLNFDLSVYDIFGLLSVGGRVVFPENKWELKPGYWHELVEKHGVSIWNSVPAFMQMYVEYCESVDAEENRSMKTVLMSGDWINNRLPKRQRRFFPDTKIVSLGGATEAAIWSITHECSGELEYKGSVPYGAPLKNQEFQVLDGNYNECPVGVTGELYILGRGLAQSYYNDKELTDRKFLHHPVNGKRMYATGDMGRYMPGGEIEFIGRVDNQVKVRGHRIELGEIEAALMRSPGVKEAVAIVDNDNIHSFVTGETPLDSEGLIDFSRQHLPVYMVPAQIVPLNSFPLTSNGKVDRKSLLAKAQNRGAAVEDEEYTETEAAVRKIVCEVMDSEVGSKKDSLYNYGAESLKMSQITGNLREGIAAHLEFDALLSQIMNYPTISEIAQFIEKTAR